MFRPDRMRQRRDEKGLTQRQLADKMETTQQTINRYEHGRTPAPDMLVKLAEALETTVSWLYEKTDDAEQLSDSERELVHIYRRMNAKERNALLRELFRKYESGKS